MGKRINSWKLIPIAVFRGKLNGFREPCGSFFILGSNLQQEILQTKYLYEIDYNAEKRVMLFVFWKAVCEKSTRYGYSYQTLVLDEHGEVKGRSREFDVPETKKHEVKTKNAKYARAQAENFLFSFLFSCDE